MGFDAFIAGIAERLQWSKWLGVLFENRPALYFCNYYIFISAYNFFLFRIKDTVSDLLSVLLNFIANYDYKNENIAPYCQ